MNPSVGVSIAAAAVAAVFVGIGLAIARAPGWAEYRWYALVAGTAAVYVVCDTVPPVSRDAVVVAWASRVSLLAAGVHGYGWIRYIAAGARRRNTRFERVVGRATLVVGTLSLVPGLVVGDSFTVHSVHWLGVTYADATTGPIGLVVYTLDVLSLLVPLSFYVRRWREPAALAHAAGIACLVVAGANDAAVASDAYSAPYLIDVGFFAVVLAVGGSMGARFLTSALALERLSTRLEEEVAERTARLGEALADAQRNERLASIGRLAAGVAHEIRNPTAAVSANLEYLDATLADGGAPPDDARACVQESLMSVERITHIVQQLLAAGRVAGGSGRQAPSVGVAALVANALALSRPARAPGVEVRVEVPDGLRVRATPLMVEQVLVNLLANAGQALADVARPGMISVAAERRGEVVAIHVRDNGGGIPDSARERIFEAFFTTKPLNEGTGLGLAVSLGLVRSLGGDLRVEATSASGTTMLVELPGEATGARDAA